MAVHTGSQAAQDGFSLALGLRMTLDVLSLCLYLLSIVIASTHHMDTLYAAALEPMALLHARQAFYPLSYTPRHDLILSDPKLRQKSFP